MCCLLAECGTENMALPKDIEIAALGRPFALGMLYDCRTDRLVPGVTLWDHDELQRNTDERQQRNSEFNITTLDSIEEKSNSLNVSGSLKLSLHGGLVNVAGSAKYFQDTKKSHKQERITLQYKTTTRYKALTMSHLGRGKVSYPNVFEEDTATHVVTAILYGANAYFVFDRELSNDENKKEVEGEAEIMMEKLKLFTVNASFNMDEKEKLAVEKFSCTFHGDFQLPSNPSTFSEAVNVYRQLPTLLGDNGEHAIPVKVWLYPLVKLDSKAAKLHREISNSLSTHSSEVIEHLNKTEMRCHDLVEDTAAKTFSAMKKKLRTFMQNCHHYKLEFVGKLESVLPSIRGGGKEESALEDILKAHEKSPFNSGALDVWLKQKEKESETLKSFLKQLEKHGLKLDDNLDDILSDVDITNIVSFSFTSLDQPDSSLVKQSNFLTPTGMMTESLQADVPQSINTDWLTDTRQSMRRQLQLFVQLKKMTNSDATKFIVSSKYDECYPGACIFIYEDGNDEPVTFIPPSKPATPTTSDVSFDALTVEVSDPDSATAEYRVEFRKWQETDWTSHPVQKNKKTVTLSGLKPGTKYEIRATAVGKLGYVVSSEIVTVVTAKPTSSPPTNLQVEIALRPGPLGPPDYIDLLIQSEEQEARPGYLRRIKALQEMRERAVIVQKRDKIAQNDEIKNKGSIHFLRYFK
ncbi:verrucotoxin subunit beta-like [Engraulis encrasicolus]|uniref:verrucotoxin subunit beta-like n=1 Tax=Engraulis encrasicolus TaxID=184585 RepID=UPI002FD197E3